MQIKYSTKLNQKEVRTLRRLSEQTRIPQSKLLQEAIHLLEAQFSNDIVTPEFRRLVDLLEDVEDIAYLKAHRHEKLVPMAKVHASLKRVPAV